MPSQHCSLISRPARIRSLGRNPACAARCCVLLAALFASFAVRAQESAAERPASSARAYDELYGGVVLGQTVTVAGQDFYQAFVTLWRDKAISDRSLLVIRERPSARTGSTIWIETQGRRLLQLSLPASRSQTRRISEQAVEETWQRLVEAELEAKLGAGLGAGLGVEQDLGRDEL